MSGNKIQKNTVALRERKLRSGEISLFLDTYIGGERQYKFLKLYIHPDPKTPEEREHNKETLILAEKIRTKHQSELDHNLYGFTPPHKKKVNIHDFIKGYISRYQKRDKRMVEASYNRFIDYLKEYRPQLSKTIRADQFSKSLIEGYRDYLLEHGKGEGPRSYYMRFKKIMQAAVEDKIFQENPTKGVSCRTDEGIRKAILSLEEIQRLAETKCGNPEVKRAFLFSCYSGIRYCDIKKLTYGNIDFENNRLQFEQAKTKGHSSRSLVTLDLSPTMKLIIGDKGKNKKTDLVFKLKSHNAGLSNLKHWMKRAGIDKHITWHCARHSFATLMLTEANTDLKTLSGLLGHSDLKYANKYTHIVDERKREALNSLPGIKITE